MIEVKNISFKYAGQKNLVFDDFSLTLKQDNIYGLLGKNGTGKSTLLYLISGLLRPKKGAVCFDSVETKLRKPETLSEIFIVPEEFDLPAMSLNQYVKINEPFYPRFNREVLEACLKDFELSTNLKLNALSMGQKKKVYMAFALATNTKVLLMDEPTNGLDIPSKSQIRKEVAETAAANLKEQMIQNIAKGRMAKFFKENCLVDQEFQFGDEGAKESVAQWLDKQQKGLKVVAFKRFSLSAD